MDRSDAFRLFVALTMEKKQTTEVHTKHFTYICEFC